MASYTCSRLPAAVSEQPQHAGECKQLCLRPPAVYCRYYGPRDCGLRHPTQRCDVYGSEEGYTERVMVLYDGLHYDALALAGERRQMSEHLSKSAAKCAACCVAGLGGAARGTELLASPELRRRHPGGILECCTPPSRHARSYKRCCGAPQTLCSVHLLHSVPTGPDHSKQK